LLGRITVPQLVCFRRFFKHQTYRLQLLLSRTGVVVEKVTLMTVPLAATLIPTGFFFSVLRPNTSEAGSAVNFIFVGAISLAVGVLTLGVGLLRSQTQ
ncbi:MAG TPA: hypothetical protein VF772_14250, partial [Terriglobales bacterium]